jgi:large subunit ribosomal protein L25
MEITELKASVRNQSGKGSSRRLRRDGFIPAVFYGEKTESILLAVKVSEMIKLLKSKEENVFIKLLISNGQNIEKLSMIKELQTDPLTKRLFHADFYEIRMDQTITFDIPIHFTGVPAGVDDGGELHHLKRDLKVSCLPTALPDFIEIDISGLHIGDSFRVQEIRVADGILVLDPKDAAIATVTAVKAAKEAVSAEEAEMESMGEAKEKEE